MANARWHGDRAEAGKGASGQSVVEGEDGRGCSFIGEVRIELRRALSLDQDLYRLTMGRSRFDDLEDLLRWDGPLGRRIDELRAAAIEEMNRCLEEAGLNRLVELGS